MSNAVKLSPKLGKDEEMNGLDSVADGLLEGQTYACLAWVVPVKDVRDIKNGTHQPLVQIARIEPLGAPANLPGAVIEAYKQAFTERTGAQEMIPLEVTETVEGGFVEPAAEEE